MLLAAAAVVPVPRDIAKHGIKNDSTFKGINSGKLKDSIPEIGGEATCTKNSIE
jgi:hypothetical protein